jgi:two-component system, cell cycle response regulator
VAFTAMRARRPYRAALSEREAAAEICAGRGSQFDPLVVDAFLAELGGEPPLVSARSREPRASSSTS